MNLEELKKEQPKTHPVTWEQMLTLLEVILFIAIVIAAAYGIYTYFYPRQDYVMCSLSTPISTSTVYSLYTPGAYALPGVKMEWGVARIKCTDLSSKDYHVEFNIGSVVSNTSS